MTSTWPASSAGRPPNRSPRRNVRLQPEPLRVLPRQLHRVARPRPCRRPRPSGPRSATASAIVPPARREVDMRRATSRLQPADRLDRRGTPTSPGGRTPRARRAGRAPGSRSEPVINGIGSPVARRSISSIEPPPRPSGHSSSSLGLLAEHEAEQLLRLDRSRSSCQWSMAGDALSVFAPGGASLRAFTRRMVPARRSLHSAPCRAPPSEQPRDQARRRSRASRAPRRPAATTEVRLTGDRLVVRVPENGERKSSGRPADPRHRDAGAQAAARGPTWRSSDRTCAWPSRATGCCSSRRRASRWSSRARISCSARTRRPGGADPARRKADRAPGQYL